MRGSKGLDGKTVAANHRDYKEEFPDKIKPSKSPSIKYEKIAVTPLGLRRLLTEGRISQLQYRIATWNISNQR